MAFPLAGIIAPVLTRFFYPLIGVTGIILIDLTTFVLAVLVVFWLHIRVPCGRRRVWRRRAVCGTRCWAGCAFCCGGARCSG